MALSRFLKGSANRREEPPAPAPAPVQRGPTGLPALLAQGVQLQEQRMELLRQGLDEGLKFFEEFNNARLELAFGAFDEAMRKALFEVIYLIHVNEQRFAELTYTAVELERLGGVVREQTREATANLYVEDAPHGVEGLAHLSPVYKEAFEQHIRDEFGAEVVPTSTFGYCPVKSIHSLGSIGTVGHKSQASDLDLQVQYELEPFLIDYEDWSDQTLRDAINTELKSAMSRLRAAHKLDAKALQNGDVKQRLQNEAMGQVRKAYPNLYRIYITKELDAAALTRDEGHNRRTQTLHEMMQLMKRAQRITQAEELKRQEALLQKRLKLIQEFIASKYPMAEIYLFACTNDDYRRGKHGSTLVSKEASGSAYELILNYETLMPGIQLTPVVPAHFVLPKQINDDPSLYDRIIDYIRFNQLGIYDEVRPRLVNLGPTPDLGQEYVAKHAGAVYWEAFKASSGNLPKALLNLFRYETLLDLRFQKTNIQLIKEPGFMDQYASPKPEDDTADMEAVVNDQHGLPPWAVLELEGEFPLLRQDPWWLRYKSLKIAYHEPEGLGPIEREERSRISRIVDLAFALHVRISDVFTKPGDTRPMDSHREQVLQEYLRWAFPPISPRRQFLEHLFIGEVRSVNQFEHEMRDLFKRCLGRVNTKVAELAVPGQSNQKEFEIWYHYYQENFEPGPNVVQRTILSHLKVPRGRLQMGYQPGEGWLFKSVQRESSIGKRFDTFGYLNHLPAEVVLRDRTTFVAGLAEAVLNGYYGILNKGTLKETRTDIEFDPKMMDLGARIDNTMAYLRPDSVHRILNMMIEFFPPRPYHYMDCIEKPRVVTELIVLLNVFKFGRLSLLYRDNLQTWYCEELDHPDIYQRAHVLHHDVRAALTAKPLHVSLARFVKSKRWSEDLAVEAWVNPHSIQTSHSAQQVAAKEKHLSGAFRTLLLQVHGRQMGIVPEEEKQQPEEQKPEEQPAEGAGS